MALTTVDREPGRFRNASPGPQLFILCIIAMTLMVLDHRNEYLTGVRKTLSVLLYPVELLVSAPANLRRSVNETFMSRSELLAENQRLKAEALARSARLQKLTALQAENARLRALLDSTSRVAEDLLIAEIVAIDLNPFRNMIVINKGSHDGIFVGQPLIDADEVVGQITRDRVFSAEAMLVTDVDHALPVEIARNRLRTIAVGTGELDRLSLPYLPRNADVSEGDLLVTSGLGGKFPSGYPVGVVRTVQSTTGQPFLEVAAQPAAALNRIREVLLIKPREAAVPAAPAVPAAAGDEQP
ncbi:MAG: rod shape-determining protein MreC [Gammaproteobacteria bacterium]|jgi:rod shape-determining protein MreC|nr:rod shape-determining protein MreC [Gammaproteobacteria bacterium]